MISEFLPGQSVAVWIDGNPAGTLRVRGVASGVVTLEDDSVWYTNGSSASLGTKYRISQITDATLDHFERKKQVARVAELMRHMLYRERLSRLDLDKLKDLERILANMCAVAARRSYDTLPAKTRQQKLKQVLRLLEDKLKAAERTAVSPIGDSYCE